ncbi:GNAT family N-acetyltransferase [Streptomyces sp. NBC_01255]|uniref:GNAT family N-acetyltransferase n=1 Tax=Streptomyces sp. NBC_01255 TaxID=2903798 RepID=UPI002E33EFEF|nr:GNAT family N-acetyltransferase [Streptomyces sp. NBC_01255]
MLSRTAGTDALLVTPAAEPERAIALGSTHPHSPGVAEIGVLVEDTWQRRGVGRLLLRRLTERCRLQGVAALTAQTLSGRRALLGVVREEAAGPLEYGPLSDTVRMTATLAARSSADAQL